MDKKNVNDKEQQSQQMELEKTLFAGGNNSQSVSLLVERIERNEDNNQQRMEIAESRNKGRYDSVVDKINVTDSKIKDVTLDICDIKKEIKESKEKMANNHSVTMKWIKGSVIILVSSGVARQIINDELEITKAIENYINNLLGLFS